MPLKQIRVSIGIRLLLCLVIVSAGMMQLYHVTAPKIHQNHLNEALIAAIKSRNADGVSAALNAGANPNTIGETDGRHEFAPPWDNHGTFMPALSLYLAENYTDDSRIATLLIDAGADVNFVSNDCDTTPLMSAASHDQIQMMNYLLAHGARINKTNLYGKTTLHFGMYSSKEQTIQFLLDAGAEIEAVDSQGNTPLHDACHSGKPAFVTLLLRHQAHVNPRNIDGETPLDFAGQDPWSPASIALVAILKKAGAKTGRELDANLSNTSP